MNGDKLISFILTVYNKEFLTACNYCNGRDFNTKEIKAAIQKPTSKPLEFKKF